MILIQISQNNKLNELSGKDWVKSTKSWFALDVEKKNYPHNLSKSWIVVDGKRKDIPKEVEDHPATFPPELVEKFILFFTKKGQNILDPFVGVGSTLVACYNTDRNGYGIELNEKYSKYAKKRINDLTTGKLINKDLILEVVNKDALEIDKIELPEIDFVITSPPYWDMLRKSRGNIKSSQKQREEKGLDTIYSNHKEDFGNISRYEEYLDKMNELFTKIHSKLRKGAYIVIIAQNVRVSSGEMRPVAWDLANKLSKTYRLMQEYIWCQDQKFLGCWGYPSTYVSNVHHHHCLVLQKRIHDKNEQG